MEANKIQQKPVQKSTTPKYDQVLMSCVIDPFTHKGTVSIHEIIRANVPVADKLAEDTNKLVEQRSKGLNKYWFKTGIVKAGQVYNATEEGIEHQGSASYLVIGSLYSEVVVKTVETPVEKPEATDPESYN